MLRLRAEALAEHREAPTGLGRMGDCGLKPSLSTGKPRRGLGVESWERGRLAACGDCGLMEIEK